MVFPMETDTLRHYTRQSEVVPSRGGFSTAKTSEMPDDATVFPLPAARDKKR